MAGRIVLFGATGYSGQLTAQALVKDGARPVLAARSEQRVRALAEELGGLQWAVADVSQPQSIAALVGSGDVLVSTVGPFNRWGDAAITAAIDSGAHYLDSTGEGRFIREVFESYGPRAQTAGCGLLTAFGYDWVPGNLAGAMALRDAGERATRVEIGYFATGGLVGPSAMSGGTRASAAGVMLDRAYALRDGRVTDERGGKRMRHFELEPGRRGPGISVGSSEHFTLTRVHPTLREVDVYLGWFGPASQVMRGLSLSMDLLTRVPGAKNAIERAMGRLVQGSTGGPDEAFRAKSGSLVFAEAFDASGTRLSQIRLEGVNGYDFTARILAWGARTVAANGLQGSGALGPVDGFGLDALTAGCAGAGITSV
jgi:short subunit dehydrogenase-like uncharacterized protein